MNQTVIVTTREQLQQCLDIRLEVFVQEQQIDPSLELDEFDESPEACTHILLLIDGQPAAAARMRPYDDATMRLQRIAVLKKHRGTGTGRAIVLALEEEARKQGYSQTVLDAQCYAEPFYHKLGYVTVSPESFLDAGIPHVRMTKQL